MTARRPHPDRRQTIDGLLAEYRSFADLLDAIDAFARQRPTRCTGWQVRDVAGHVVDQASDALSGTLGSRTPDQQAAEFRDRSAAAVAAELRGDIRSMAGLLAMVDDDAWLAPSPVAGLTLGQGVHTLRSDAYIHADDVRAAVGQRPIRGPGLDASLECVLGALARDNAAAADPGIARFLAVSAAGFTTATGIDAHDYLLAATGRLDPARLGLPATINIYR